MKKQSIILSLLAFLFTGGLQASSTPSMSRIYGNQFTGQVADSQSAATIGTLDATFGSSGNLSINGALSGAQAVGIQVLSNGNFVVVLAQSGSSAVVAEYNAEGVLQSSYGSSGISTLDEISMASAVGTFVDAQGRLLVGAGNAAADHGVIYRVPAAGAASVSSLVSDINFNYFSALAQQSTGQIIAVGFDGTNAKFARYSLNGSIDSTFGTSGYVNLNGSGSLPTVTTPLASVYVDSSNKIYVAFIASATANSFTSGNAYIARFTASGSFDTAWGTSGIVSLSALNGANTPLRIAKNNDGNLIVSAQVSSHVVVTGVTSTGTAIGGFTTFNTSSLSGIGSNTFIINQLLTTSDDSIFLIGSDTTAHNMSVIRLVGSTGALDTVFNPSLGYNDFQIAGGTITTSTLSSASFALDGQLYVAGYQVVDTPATTPYVSRLNNTQYVTQVAQFPLAQEQGILDQTFGSTGSETYTGVVSPFNGSYGSSLQQKVATMIEVTAGSVTYGDIVVGMNGFTNTSADSNMMFSWLTSAGAIDTTVANSGFLTLENTTASNEYMTSIAQDGSGNLYVAGYASATLGGASTQAFLRTYSSFSSGTAASSNQEISAGYQGVGVSIQGANRALLCVAESSTVGHISAYAAGTLDTTFGDGGSGYIDTTSYGLHMGPCYGLAINDEFEIYAAYLDSDTSEVNLVAFLPDGSALINTFGSSGIVANIFPSNTVAANNIRIGFRKNTIGRNDIIIAAVDATDILLACYDAQNGVPASDFNNGSILSVSITGATSLNLAKVTGVSDGTVLVTFSDNAADDTMYVARVATDGSSLDATFNSQGSQQGLLPIKIGSRVADYNARVASSLIVQSTFGVNQGNIVVAGYESVTSNDATPMAMRVYGDLGSTEIIDYPVNENIPGTLQAAFDLDVAPGISAGSGNVVFAYPGGNTQQGKLLIGIDNGTTSVVARVYEASMTLDSSFGSGGVYTFSSLTGISHISIDSNNNLLVGGTTTGGSPTAWAYTISDDGTTTHAFNINSTYVQNVNHIYQQESGRYIVIGNAKSNVIPAVTPGSGLIVAFQDVLSDGSYQVDRTFNPLANAGAISNYPAGSGYYLVENSGRGLYTAAINTQTAYNPDTIVIAYASGSSVLVSEITANGSGRVAGFNSGSVLSSGVSTDGSSAVQLNIDSSGNIIVAASYNSGGTHQIQAQRFDSAGGATTAFTNGGIVSGNVATISTTYVGTGVVLSGLMELTSQRTVLVGYNGSGANGRLIAARLGSNGQFDTTWNPSPTGTDTAGILTYGGASAENAVDILGGAIAVDGLVLSIGSTAIGTSGDPVLTIVYGDSYVVQVAQNPLQSAAGVLDTTLPSGSTGAKSLSGLVTGVPQRVSIYDAPGATNALGNGAVMIASSNGTNSYVTKLNADLTAGSSFGTSGVVTFSSQANITDMYLQNTFNSNTQSPIFVAGNNAGAMWGATISADGTTAVKYLASGSGLTTGNVIRQTNNGRILVAGYNGTSGAIAAFSAISTAAGTTYPLDTSFGNNANSSPNYGGGIFATGVATQIYAMTVDSLDRIYIAYKNGAAISVVRLLANGTAVDSTFSATFTTAVNSYAASQISMAIDLTNNQLVVAAQDGTSTSNIIQVARFSTTDGSSAGSTSSVTISGKVLNLADLFIDALQNIYVIAYNATDNKSVVARIASTSSTTIALDTANYAVAGGTPGIANVAAGSISVVKAGAYNPDRRTYLVGTDGLNNQYIARLFGDVYTTQMSQALTSASVGSIDTSLQPNNTGGIDLSGTLASGSATWSTLGSGYKARAVIENSTGDGSSFIAFSNGTNLILGKLNADMIPVTAFGDSGSSNGLTATRAMSVVNSITQDALGNLVVAGNNSGAQTVMLWNASGTYQATFASTGTNGKVVGQQKSGRYIVGGYNGSTGLIWGYKNPSAISGSALALDATFGPNGSNGYYQTGVAAIIDDLCIDSNDYIYYVYRNLGTVYVAKLTAEGSLSTEANTPLAERWAANPIATSITNATQPAHIAINAAGNILVGASTSNNSNDIQVQLYNGASGTTIGSLLSGSTIANTNTPVLTQLVGCTAPSATNISGTASATNEFYGTFYTSATTVGVFAVNASGAIDTSFGTLGVTTTTVQSPVLISSLTLQSDGKLVAVGFNNAGSGLTADPILLRFNGYQYLPGQVQAPDQAACGTLDTTLWPTTGALELDTYTPISDTIATLAGSRVKRLYEYSDGKALFVCDNANSGSDTVLMRVNKDLTLDSSFNSNGYVTISGQTNANALFVDSSSNIYVAGGIGATSWLRAYSTSGGNISAGWANPTSNLANGAYQVATQSNSRIVVAGKGSSDGMLYGYNTSGSLDASFGVDGIVDTTATNTITDFAIDSYDNILTVENAGGTVIMRRISPTGLTLTTLSGGTAINTATSGSAIKNCIDANGYIIVAAATSTGFVVRSYNNNSTGTNNAGSAVTITAGSSSPAWVIANLYATSDGKVVVVGYDSALASTTAGQIMVARLVSGASSLTLDTTTFNVAGASPSGAGYLVTSVAPLDSVYDGMISADDRIMIAGSNSTSAEPYIARVFGDDYVSYVSQGSVAGTAGVVDRTFGNTSPTNGMYTISTLNALLSGAQGQAILPLSDGGFYIALNDANALANSILIKTVADGTLDTTYNNTVAGHIAGIAGSATSANYAPLGVNSILQDAAGNIVMVGTTSGAGWVQRYTSSGTLDTTFNGTGIINFDASTAATVAVEQTSGRLVVAGKNSSGNGALFAYKSVAPNGTPGSVDTTFNAGTGGTPGTFATSIANQISNLVADQYDRLIFAILNGSNVNLYRLTPTGVLDVTFGSNGIVTNAISTAANAASVRVALDAVGNIIVAATSSTANTFSVAAFDNGISTTAGGNGGSVYSQLNINSLTAPSVTSLVTSADGYALVLGTQSGTNDAWIARITAGGGLDTGNFNPSGLLFTTSGSTGGGAPGIFQWNGGGSTAHVYNGLAVKTDGTLAMVGYENSGGAFTPELVAVYDDPYTSQESQSPDAKPVGTDDATLGVGTGVNNGIIYYGSNPGLASYGQIARALALYNDNNIVVAIDGGDVTSANSSIFIDMFDNDGLLNPNFGTDGRATVLQGSSSPTAPNYQNQFVRDMITFTTTAGVHKAILAGYVTNNTLGSTDSLLLQYNLDTPGLDSSFGGYNGNPSGIAMGDGQSLFAVGQQSTGRIIASGLAQNNVGLLLGYTSTGNLDNSFANNGYQSVGTGSSGIYTHAIDAQNRIIIAYNNAGSVAVVRFLADGSAVDSSFDASDDYISTVTSDSNMKVAVDSSNNVYAAAVVNSGNWIDFASYSQSNGTLILGATITGADLGNGSAVFTISRLIIDAAGNIVTIAYDSNAHQIVVFRLTSAFGIDTTFNGTGYIRYAVGSGSSSQIATDALIHPDGRILVVGSEN